MRVGEKVGSSVHVARASILWGSGDPVPAQAELDRAGGVSMQWMHMFFDCRLKMFREIDNIGL